MENYLRDRVKTTHRMQLLYLEEGKTFPLELLEERVCNMREELKDKENVRVYTDVGQGEYDHDCYIMISWTDWETEDEYNHRMYEKKLIKDRAVESLKKLIELNPVDAVRIVKEFDLI